MESASRRLSPAQCRRIEAFMVAHEVPRTVAAERGGLDRKTVWAILRGDPHTAESWERFMEGLRKAVQDPFRLLEETG